jgi:hypothetical protein
MEQRQGQGIVDVVADIRIENNPHRLIPGFRFHLLHLISLRRGISRGKNRYYTTANQKFG